MKARVPALRPTKGCRESPQSRRGEILFRPFAGRSAEPFDETVGAACSVAARQANTSLSVVPSFGNNPRQYTPALTTSRQPPNCIEIDGGGDDIHPWASPANGIRPRFSG